jgi:hypothetical protein
MAYRLQLATMILTLDEDGGSGSLSTARAIVAEDCW